MTKPPAQPFLGYKGLEAGLLMWFLFSVLPLVVIILILVFTSKIVLLLSDCCDSSECCASAGEEDHKAKDQMI